MVVWTAICFIYYGITLLLPTILQRVFVRAKANHNFKYIYMIAISALEILSYSLAPRIMNNPRVGRKKAVYSCLFITFLGSLSIIAFGEENIFALFVLMAIVKTTNTVSFAVLLD